MRTTGNPKIFITTTPIGPVPWAIPPIGSLSVITSLKKAGFTNTHFLNFDQLRPDYKDFVQHIGKEKPDILGISAVVSTAYGFTKNLSLDVKQISPQTTIILGGNLGASAEILLKKTGVDFICTGEGEKTIVDFVQCWIDPEAKNKYEKVKGIAFLDDEENLKVTPFAEPLAPNELYDIDWSILEDLELMDFFIPPVENSFFHYYMSNSSLREKLSREPKRRGKTFAMLTASKGCVARCTFCHRWDKGFRSIPVSLVMERIDYFIHKHNMGFANIVDENFGADSKWLTEFLHELKKRDLIWSVGGLRVNTLSKEVLIKMKDAGCIGVVFGLETGSQKILDVMEKKTTVEQNLSAIKWLTELKMSTIIRYVIGMPGESPQTILETGNFHESLFNFSKEMDPNATDISFLLPLPGTSLYEVARAQKLIGQSVDDEEKYLLQVSDRWAADGTILVNLTDFPKLLLEKWRFELMIRGRASYIKSWGLKSYFDQMFEATRSDYFKQFRAKGVLEIPHLRSAFLRKISFNSAAAFYPRFFWFTRFFSQLYVWFDCCRWYGVKSSCKLLFDYLNWVAQGWLPYKGKKLTTEYISLRKLLRKNFFPKVISDNPAMAALRKGR